MKFRNVVLVDGARSAFGRGGIGKLTATRLDTAGAHIIRALLDRNPKIKDTMIEDVGLGNIGGALEINFLCAVQRLAGLPMESCCFVSNRQCGSSMETLHKVALSIMVGSIDCGMALGIERMGRGLGMPDMTGLKRNGGFNPELMKMNKVQRDMAHDHDENYSVKIPDGILDMLPLMAMTQTAQNVAEMYNLSRAEIDAFAAKSHQKADEAYAKGIYKDEIIPLEVEDPVIGDDKVWVDGEKGEMIIFDRDECIRPSTSPEKLAALKPIGGIMSPTKQDIIITPGNSCPTNDGISCAILMAEEKAIELGLEPIARIVGIGVGGVKPQLMGLGPISSTHKACANAGIDIEQIDRVEFNEAFAAQALPCIRELGIDEAKVNVNGGSIAIGHPIGATGTRLVTTVAMELRRSNSKYALATQCIGSGMGISTILEALD